MLDLAHIGERIRECRKKENDDNPGFWENIQGFQRAI